MPGQLPSYKIRTTRLFDDWLHGLRDKRAKNRIDARVRRLATGNFGDAKAVGQGVSELRIDYGPGYRVYFYMRKSELIMLLCGGDKSTQQRDIVRACKLAEDAKE